MRKVFLAAFIIILVLAAGAYFIEKKTVNKIPATTQYNRPNSSNAKLAANATNSQTLPNPNQVGERDSSIPSNYKTYTNIKYGFTFQYPETWVKDDKEAEITNSLGALITVEIYFRDTVVKTILLLSHHLAPAGAELFKYQFSQYNSKQGWYANNGGSKMIVAGNTAILSNDTISKNGKGYPINPPLKSVIVDFLDKTQLGTFELQFKTPLPIADSEEAKFKYLLSTFRVLN